MSDQESNEQRLAFWLPAAAVALTTAAVLFFSVWGWQTGRIEGSEQTAASETIIISETATATEMAASSPADAILAADTQNNDDAKIIIENGIVKFYFATGKADLAAGAGEALQDVLAGVKEGRKAVISGFHDETGNQAQNEELSKQRAFAVRDALLGFGVPEAQIELRKPENAEGSGSNAEARRVEVVLE
ncbi:OmpA family protein [Uruburuella testudinis]|uniref:OmpA family protein n=1 Tax=Uruburuella testudinis TaxID=1282863 RepID=A0ABY4DU19_9NEIS|nr:OmpA family protein [Uruburuella testudinis]UOO82535.1 OmpA family protein [Uruburuella testudinis]